MNRQEKKRLKTIATIKTIFMELLLEGVAFEEITVKEITERADFNRSTFYLYFQDKYELAESLFNESLQAYTHAVMSPYEEGQIVVIDGEVPSDQLIFDCIEDNKQLFSALDRLQISPTIYERMEQTCLAIFSTNIQLVQEKKDPSINYDLFLHYQVAAMIGLIKYWIRNNFEESATYMSEQFRSFYTYKIKAMNITRK